MLTKVLLAVWLTPEPCCSVPLLSVMPAILTGPVPVTATLGASVPPARFSDPDVRLKLLPALPSLTMLLKSARP